MMFGLIAAANRDPAQVKEPEAFDVTREQVPSLTFGGGPHYCLGAYLAGMQGEILFPRLLRRFPRMRPGGDPVYRTPAPRCAAWTASRSRWTEHDRATWVVEGREAVDVAGGPRARARGPRLAGCVQAGLYRRPPPSRAPKWPRRGRGCNVFLFLCARQL